MVPRGRWVQEVIPYLFLLSAVYASPLWIHALVDRLGLAAAGQRWLDRDVTWNWAALQAVTCGVLCALVLVFRSRTSLDFIYFQF